MNLRPLSDLIVVKRAPSVEVTAGGIVIPINAQEELHFGKVVAVGPGKSDDKGQVKAMELRVGDHVLFSSYAGTEVKTGDDQADYLIMSEEDILGVLV